MDTIVSLDTPVRGHPVSQDTFLSLDRPRVHGGGCPGDTAPSRDRPVSRDTVGVQERGGEGF